MRVSLRAVIGFAAGCLACGMLVSCSRSPSPAPVIGEAYVGPHSLKLRADISLQSQAVATVKHGDRLEIVQRRRRFLKVRGPGGVEGWVHERQLLAAAEMAELRDLSRQAKELPAQGQASTFGELNVHTQPVRQSPSFVQIKEGEKVDVLLHRSFPRAESQRPPLIPPAPKKEKPAKKPAKEAKVPPPPMPRPPGAPPNWIELSKTEMPPEPPKEEVPAAPVPTDRWSLVRLPNGTTGWVLTARLMMAIPDDVAQYAEGRRIVSYFPLGDVLVDDDGQKRRNWLWTTAGEGAQEYDFDSFRVFVWNLRRHRYETAYIERNVRGYAPVITHDVKYALGRGEASSYPGFSICMDKKDGTRARREFAFIGNIVRFAGERACEAPPALSPKPADSPPPQPVASVNESLVRRLKRGVRSVIDGLTAR